MQLFLELSRVYALAYYSTIMYRSNSVIFVASFLIQSVLGGVISDLLNLGLTRQKITVKGKLMCGTIPAIGVNIKLVDIDVGFDDVMARVVTDKNGEFVISGMTEERTRLDGVVKIYHDCDDYLPCQRRWRLNVPKQYIFFVDSKNSTDSVLDIGTMNLEVRIFGEDRDCYH